MYIYIYMYTIIFAYGSHGYVQIIVYFRTQDLGGLDGERVMKLLQATLKRLAVNVGGVIWGGSKKMGKWMGITPNNGWEYGIMGYYESQLSSLAEVAHCERSENRGFGGQDGTI